jgi:antitoxin (DNA-binding transcriptional repressor) of toxin-antitoxin stability system
LYNEADSLEANMKEVKLAEAQEHLDELIGAVLEGESVFIERPDHAVVQLTLVQYPYSDEDAKKPRQPGSAKGQIWMADDFDAPMELVDSKQ